MRGPSPAGSAGRGPKGQVTDSLLLDLQIPVVSPHAGLANVQSFTHLRGVSTQRHLRAFVSLCLCVFVLTRLMGEGIRVKDIEGIVEIRNLFHERFEDAKTEGVLCSR